MITNPFADPLFLPTAVRVGGVLGLSFVALCVVERQYLGEMWRRTLFRRWATWLAITLVYGFTVLGGLLTSFMLVSALVFQGLREYAALVGLPPSYRRALLSMGLLAVAATLVSGGALMVLTPLLLVAATLQPVLLQDVRSGVRHLALAAFGWGYLPLLLSHFLLVHRDVPGGPGILLALAVAVGLSDIGAYIIGTALGRRRLAPAISPNKTWEGVAGNFAGACLGLGLMSFALPEGMAPLAAWGLPAVVAAASVLGDLFESLLKREFQVKDTGGWLPGFGGLLDRIDSFVLALPVSYYFLRAAA